jgi:UDP-2,3-diacylglucosamine pyrophosphatase LpxH
MWERLGGKQLSGPQFARKLEVLYKPYREIIMQNAVHYAKEHGFDAVVCGHTHYPEDRIVDGIRYINTGGWTEQQSFYLLVNNEEVSLKIVETSINSTWGKDD